MGSKKFVDKLDGDELDLSMMRLTEIPVSEIAAIPRAKKIDLSNNELVNVSPSFATYLSHVTRLDLSSNKITALPDEFGELVNLRHLDLYNNQITDLPSTLSNLKNLRYIDLKNNPLEPDISKVVGTCTDIKECQLSAKKLLQYLNKLKKQRSKEANFFDRKLKAIEMAKARQEEEERERKKAEKKASKEKRRLEMERKEANGALVLNGGGGKAQQAKKEAGEKKGGAGGKEAAKANNNNNNNNNSSGRKGSGVKATSSSSSRKWSVLGLLNVFLFLVVLFAAGTCAALYVEGDLSVEGLKAAWPRLKRNSVVIFNRTREALKYENLKTTAETCWKTVGPFALKVQEVLILSYTASRNLAVNAFTSLQTVTGDLTPYLEGVKPLWNKLVQNVCTGFVLAVDWVSSLDWCCLLGGVRWTATFIADQVRVANAELWSNKAVLSGWEDIKPVRQFLWANTETVRGVVWQLGTDVQIYWLPFIQRESYNLYTYGKTHIESLFS